MVPRVSYVGKKLLVFGGGDGKKATNDTILIDLPTLSTVTLETRGKPPQERVGHAMAIVRAQFVYGAHALPSPTWHALPTLPPSSSTVRNLLPHPGGLRSPSRLAISQISQSRDSTVFGGFVRKLGYMFDLHALHLGRVEWLQVQVGGAVPDGRINHTLCANGKTLYLFGGDFDEGHSSPRAAKPFRHCMKNR